MAAGMMMAADETEDLDVTAEEIAMVRRLRSRAVAKQISEYRKVLIQRAGCKNEKDKLPLPEGGYRTYRLAAGRHIHALAEDVRKTSERNQELFKRLGPGTPPENPPMTAYGAGDLVTPQSDSEALLMDQDPDKFRPVDARQASANVDELMAEIARLKQVETRAQELEKELAEQKKAKGGGK